MGSPDSASTHGDSPTVSWWACLVMGGVLAIAALARFPWLRVTPGWYADGGTCKDIPTHMMKGEQRCFAIGYSPLVDAGQGLWLAPEVYALLGGRIVWPDALGLADRVWLTVMSGYLDPPQQAFLHAWEVDHLSLLSRDWGLVQVRLYDQEGGNEGAVPASLTLPGLLLGLPGLLAVRRTSTLVGLRLFQPSPTESRACNTFAISLSTVVYVRRQM
jgi:hypothetical protein